MAKWPATGPEPGSCHGPRRAWLRPGPGSSLTRRPDRNGHLPVRCQTGGCPGIWYRSTRRARRPGGETQIPSGGLLRRTRPVHPGWRSPAIPGRPPPLPARRSATRASASSSTADPCPALRAGAGRPEAFREVARDLIEELPGRREEGDDLSGLAGSAPGVPGTGRAVPEAAGTAQRQITAGRPGPGQRPQRQANPSGPLRGRPGISGPDQLAGNPPEHDRSPARTGPGALIV